MAFMSGMTGAAQAGNEQITFSGIVPSHSTSDHIRDYPQTLVSFTSKVALPVQTLLGVSSDIRVFDEAGRRIANSTLAYMPTANGKQTAKLVELAELASQTFVVCAGSKKNCMRYRVARY